LGIALNYVHAGDVPHIIGKLSTKATNYFGPHLNQRSTQEVMGVQSGENLNLGNFKIPDLGIRGKITFGCSPMANHK
jgi:hypothetical protein